MNPNLRDIVKEEIQKLLEVGFIYPILDSEWVSPLVIIPKKNGKWRVCVDYRELNKATQKDHFPFPFIDQVLDTLSGKKLFSFLMGLAGTIRFRLLLKTKIKLPSLVRGEHLPPECFPLVYVMHQQHFKEL